MHCCSPTNQTEQTDGKYRIEPNKPSCLNKYKPLNTLSIYQYASCWVTTLQNQKLGGGRVYLNRYVYSALYGKRFPQLFVTTHTQVLMEWTQNTGENRWTMSKNRRKTDVLFLLAPWPDLGVCHCTGSIYDMPSSKAHLVYQSYFFMLRNNIWQTIKRITSPTQYDSDLIQVNISVLDIDQYRWATVFSWWFEARF